MFKKVLTTTVLGVSALSVMAANAAAPGVYVTGQLGYANTHMGNKTDISKIEDYFTPNNAKDKNLANNGLAGRVAMGYQFTQNFAVEAGYLQLGQANVSGTAKQAPVKLQLRQNVIDVVGKGIYPVSDKVNIYGKLGLALLNTDITAKYDAGDVPVTADLNNVAKVAKHKVAPEVALGLSYDINPNISVDVSWTHIQPLGKDRPGNVDFAAVGVGYNFG